MTPSTGWSDRRPTASRRCARRLRIAIALGLVAAATTGAHTATTAARIPASISVDGQASRIDATNPRAPRAVAAQGDPIPSAPPRVAITGVGRGFVGDVGRPADGNGDDGDTVRGRLPALVHADVLTPTTQAQNVVVDRRTRRMWVRRLDALSGVDGVGERGNVRLDRSLDWQAALDAAAALEYAGHDDWRLPTVHELDSLIDFGFSEPALDPHAFPEDYQTLPSAYFWSSTTTPQPVWHAFYVNVRDGHRYPWGKSTLFSVRPMRVMSAEELGAIEADPAPDVAIHRTGQAAGYLGIRGEPGSGNGDDGDLRPGEEQAYAWSDDGVIDTAAENVVLDVGTGLTWVRDPVLLDGTGTGVGPAAAVGGNVDLSAPLPWQAAVDGCAALDYAGHDDWRLPSIRELDSIAQPGRPDAPVDDTVFALPAASGDPDRPASWWSSTTATHPHPDQGAADGAWYVDAIIPARRHYVSPGAPPAKARARTARCVRDDAAADDDGTDSRRAGTDDVGTASPPASGWLPVVRGSADVARVAIETGVDRDELKWLMAVDDSLDRGMGDGLIARAGQVGRGDARGARAVGTKLVDIAASQHDAGQDAPPPFAIAFQDTQRFLLHQDFLSTVFPDAFGGLDAAGYEALVGRRATRRLYAGTVARTIDEDGGWVYGWDVAVADDPAEALTRAETTAIHRRLARVFRRRPLRYTPADPLRLAAVLGWSDRRLPVSTPPVPRSPDYEAYTPGVAYGTVRLLTGAQLSAAAADGALGRHDIVVVTDSAPADLEQVVAALITAAPQGALSHLAVRAARRGTPNVFDRAATARFASWEEQLVRLLVGPDALDVAAAEPAEAAAWWAAHKPEPVRIAPVDRKASDVLDLAELGALDAGDTGEGGAGSGVARYGGKATNLARLYRFLDPAHQVPGLAVPFGPFAEHMDQDAGPTGPADATFRAWVDALAADSAMADGSVRAARLAILRRAIRDEPADDALLESLGDRIEATFGAGVMVRFRSSSNAEDGLRFNGAGLYDSTSVCVADTRDGDKDGPSRCDPNQPEERTIQRGLRKVWAGLYTLRAWEERDWYGIPQAEAAMAILITPAFPDERANGVAFTGDPAQPDAPWMLVSAQDGDVSVVAPDPGTLPERSALMLEEAEPGEPDSARITRIRRVQASSLVPDGTHVLADAELLSLGSVMLDARRRFAVDTTEEPGVEPDDVLLDLEFKVRRGDDRLLIKQIRPFLPTRAETGALLVIPRTIATCGMWRVADPIDVEHAGHVEVSLTAGELRLKWDAALPVGSIGGETELGVSADAIADLRVGPSRIAATPRGPTEAVLNAVGGREDLVGLTLRRLYVDPAGGPDREVALSVPALPRHSLNVLALDDSALTEPRTLALTVSLADGGRRQLGPCGLSRLPAETLNIWATIATGSSQDASPMPLRLRLDLRKADAPLAPYQWADLVGASLALGSQTDGNGGVNGTGTGTARGVIGVLDPTRLTYDAQRHNWDERFLVHFDPPWRPGAEDGSGSGPGTGTGVMPAIGALYLTWPTAPSEPPVLTLRDAEGTVFATAAVRTWLRQREVDGARTVVLPWAVAP